MKMNFYSFLPLLYNEVGHIYEYNMSVSASAELLGWKVSAFIPNKVELKTIPDFWITSLPEDNWLKKKSKLKKVGLLFFNFFRYFSLIKKIKKEKAIIFWEHFTLLHMASFALAVFLLRPKIQIWILHRYAYDSNTFHQRAYRAVHFMIARSIGKDRLRLLTDSDLIAKINTKLFHKPFHVMPIPHGKLDTLESFVKEKSTTYFWWPGGSLRKQKGLHYIKKLLMESKKTSEKVRYILAENAIRFLGEEKNEDIISTSVCLDKKEYQMWMNTADIILLPYDPVVYKTSTSGMFVEAIIANCIPFVRKGAWMEYELKKFDLEELSLNWDEGDIFEKILEISSRMDVKKKLEEMKIHFKAFHNPQSFAAKMNDFLTTHS